MGIPHPLQVHAPRWMAPREFAARTGRMRHLRNARRAGVRTAPAAAPWPAIGRRAWITAWAIALCRDI